MIKLERDGDECMIRCDDGRSRRVSCVPADARYIGLKLKVFENVSGALRLYGSLSRAVDQIESVLDTSERQIAAARGQIEDAGGETDTLSDLDVAIMDVYVRDWLAEQAREVDDPFNPHERGFSATKTIRLKAPDLTYIFGDYFGEDAS